MLVTQLCPTVCDPMYSPWNSPGQNTGVGSPSLLQGIFPTQGSNPGLPALQASSLPAEPQRKPKNIGVGSLSLLQGIFPTQESNQDLLHCRQIFYQLSYQGNPADQVSIWQLPFGPSTGNMSTAEMHDKRWKVSLCHCGGTGKPLPFYKDFTGA